MRRAHLGWLLWLLAGCAGAGPGAAPRVSVGQLSSERVAGLLDHHHLIGGLVDATRAERMGRGLLLGLGGVECETRAWAALRDDALQLGAALQRGDTRFVSDAARACARVAPDAAAASALLWEAAAQAYDPHSHYLDAASRTRSEAVGRDAAAPVRGRSVRVDGRVFAQVQVPAFYVRSDGHTTSHDVAELWTRLSSEAPSALVLDLRGNRGGLLDEALRLLDWLGHPGPVALAVDHAGRRRALGTAARADAHAPLPIVVRIDRRTMGEAELVAAVLRQAGTPLVGESTHGKATLQTTIRLDTANGVAQGALQLTVEQLYLQCGESWQWRGVAPTHTLPATSPALATPERELRFALPAADLPGADCRPAPVPGDPVLQAAIAAARAL
jgi:hypothetical protein